MSILNRHRWSLPVAFLALSTLASGCGNAEQPEEGAGNDPSIDQRLTRIEGLLQDSKSEALMNVDSQLQQIQSDLRDLRGKLEEQEHRIDALSQELNQVKQSGQKDSLEPEPYR